MVSISDSDLSEDEYFVEKIVGKRTQGQMVEYFVKWEGYPSSENSWIKSEHMNCPKLIAEFEQRNGFALNKNRRNSNRSLKIAMINKNAGVKIEPSDSFVEFQETLPVIGVADERIRVKWKTFGRLQEIPKEFISAFRVAEGQYSYDEEDLVFDEAGRAEKLIPTSTIIIGANRAYGGINFLVKWSENERETAIPARITNLVCPKEVIAFYERHLYVPKKPKEFYLSGRFK